MSRQIPTASVSQMYSHWFAQKWSNLKSRYSTDELVWEHMLSTPLEMGEVEEILRHNPPIEHVARFFCQCRNPEQQVLAHCILDKYGTELMTELNHSERKAQYAAQSGLGKNDPMVAWDVWGAHRSLWKRYIQFDSLVFDPNRTAAQLKVLKLDGLPILVDLLSKIDLNVEQTKTALEILCADLYTAQEKPFAAKTTQHLKRCIKILVKKLPASYRTELFQTPPYTNGCWDTVLGGMSTGAPKEPIAPKQIEATQVTCTMAEAKFLRNKRLTRASVNAILSSGLDLEWQNNQEMTLLQQVVLEGLVGAVPAILAQTPNIHVRTRTEKTSVCHMAAALPNSKILKMLLESGANPWLKNTYSNNALQCAIHNLNEDAVSILTQHPQFDADNSSYALFLAQCKTSVPKWDVKVLSVFNILVKAGTNMQWSHKEYPSFVDLLFKKAPYNYQHVIPTIQKAMDDLTSYKQAIAIEQHIAAPTQTLKARKI